MRLYVPSTLDLLRTAAAEGVVRYDDPVVADSDGEEDEYAAMETAAGLSAELLEGPGRRVVLVLETASSDACDLDDLVSIHADTEPVDPQDDDLPELAWFAVQELGDLLG
ncbi:MAG: hypothetical protein EOO74_03200 [Myxococcales bacterium]|nr:MAG: hypothetical protein EOO74_03200 [Myxococcales bacterium]